MKNRYMLRKYAAILIMSLAGIISIFAQGAVIGYVNPNGVNNPNYPSVEQLRRLTHIIVVDIGVKTNGTLKYGSVLNTLPPSCWNANVNSWLTDLVNRVC